MAVYTPLSDDDIRTLLACYDIGTLASARGITEGIENTNYLLTTDHQQLTTAYILTLFEKRVRAEELPYFMHLMEWMHERGIGCPLPVRDREGRVLHAVREKPAAIVTFLEGEGVARIRQEHMAPLGDLLARMHLAGADFPHARPNRMALPEWAVLIEKIAPRAEEIQPGLTEVIQEEYAHAAEHWPDALPQGAVHADLFPDNVFFLRARGGFQLSGVIDWYFACTESWAYDLAITINAWCFDERHRLVKDRVDALLATYTDVRPLTPEEEAAMPTLLRAAALRFLLTRTHDLLFHPPGAQVQPKDPMEYVQKLEIFRGLTG